MIGEKEGDVDEVKVTKKAVKIVIVRGKERHMLRE